MAAYDVYDTVITSIDIYDMVKEYDAAAVEEAGKKLADCKKASKKKTDDKGKDKMNVKLKRCNKKG